MPKKQKKINNRLNKLFEGVQPAETPSKPKQTKVTRDNIVDPKTSPLVRGVEPVSASGAVSTPRPLKRQTAALPSLPITEYATAQQGAQASLTMSFQAGQQNWSTLQVTDENAPRTWSQDEQLLVKQVTDQLSLALENANLFQESQQRASELNILNEMALALSAETDIEQITKITYEFTSKLIDTTSYFFAIYDEKTNEIRFPLVINDGRHIENPPRKVGAGGLTDYVIRNKETVFLPDNVLEHMQEMGIEFISVGNNKPALSWLGVPLLSGNRAIGALVVQNVEKPGLYSERDRDLMLSIASQVAPALENARLIQETQKRAQRQEALYGLSTALTQAGSVAQICEAAVAALHKTLNFQYSGIFSIDAQNGDRVLMAHHGWEDAPEGWRIPPKQGLSWQAIEQREVKYWPDISQQAAYLAGSRKVSCELDVPILLGEQVLGVLIVEDEKLGAFSADDIEVLQAVSAQLAVALDSARLFEQTQQQASELQILNEMGRELASQLDIATISETVYKYTARLMETSTFFISLYNADTRQVSFPFATRENQPSQIAGRVLGNGLTDYVLRTRSALLIPEDVPGKIEALGLDLILFGGSNVPLCWLGVPMLIGEKVVGALVVQSITRKNVYSQRHQELLTAIASQVAIALENARLFQETQQLNEAIQSSNDSIITTDIEGKITQVNSAFTQITGYTPDEVIGKTPRILKSDLHPKEFYEKMWAAITAGEIWRSELVNKRKDGTLYTVDQTILPVRDDERKLTGFLATERDISESKQAQEALARSEADLRALFSSMQDIVLVIDKDTRYVRIAPTNPSLLYRPPQELLGQRMDEILPPETHEPFKIAIQRALATKETVQIEYELPVGAQKFWFLANISKLNDDQVFWVARDITERKKAEEDLTRFKLGIETSGDAVFMTDINGNIVFTNSAFETVYGYKPSEAIGQTPRILKSGLMPQEQYEHFWGKLLSKQTLTGELINKRKDGRLISIAGTNSPILDDKGNILGFLAVHHDITDRKQAEAALQRRNTYLAASSEIGRVVTSTLDLNTIFSRTVNLITEHFGFYHAGIFVVEETGFNAVLREATGEAGAEMKRLAHKLPVDAKSIVGKVTSEGKSVVVNDTANDPTHKPNPLLPRTRAEAAIPLRVGTRIIGALDIQSTDANAFTEDDIAVLQTLADQIAIAIDNARSYELSQQAVLEMREIDRLKSQFLANMSHELRTPLNSIIGFSRVILKGIDGAVTELQQQDLTAIYNSGQHLLALINDILDLSKIEAGKMELAFDEVNMADITNSVLSTMSGYIKDRPITLRRNIPVDLPTVRADAIRVRQVMLNLLSNAAKFTDEGEVVVDLSVTPGSAGFPELMISVTDSGPGISQEDQGKLFQAFSQVDDSPTRRTGGSGLGLSICQHLIEMHGGRIGINSVVGKGSTFYFTLPIFRRDNVAEHSTPHGKVILAIDDDPQVIGLYERYLQPQGFQVIPLTDPSRAVERVRQLKPFAVTLDLMMPGMDGWQVLNKLKSNPDTRNVPIIICSILEDREKGFSLGAADYLVKPILEEDLVNSLDRLNADSSIHEVLVIDDDPNDLRLIGKMLSDDGRFKPILVEGGKKGWELISSDPPPQAVILDLFMPDLDGFKILEGLRANNRLRDIPVIVISGVELTPENKKQLDEFGQRLLTKGEFNEKELFTSIQRALEKVNVK